MFLCYIFIFLIALISITNGTMNANALAGYIMSEASIVIHMSTGLLALLTKEHA